MCYVKRECFRVMKKFRRDPNFVLPWLRPEGSIALRIKQGKVSENEA